METIKQLKRRFDGAFKTYAQHDARLRRLREEVSPQVDNADRACIDAHLRVLADAHRLYRAVRLEYAERLLSREKLNGKEPMPPRGSFSLSTIQKGLT